MKASKKPAATLQDIAKERKTPPPKKETARPADKPSVAQKQALTEAEGTKGQERAYKAKPRTSPMELAMLGTLLAIHHGLENPGQKKDPTACLFDAYDLFNQAEDALDRATFLEHELAKDFVPPPSFSDVNPETDYSWRDILRVQDQAQDLFPYGNVARAKFEGTFSNTDWQRIMVNHGFGDVFFKDIFFTNKDLANRPVGFSMVGSIGTKKGLRNAIKRLFREGAEEIISRKKLSLWKINKILQDQLKIYHGRIPKVRNLKSTEV